MIRRTIREWERIAYGAGDDAIGEDIAGRLARVAAESPLAGRDGNGVLEYGRKSLRARGIVGVVAADGCALEILPKIDVPNDMQGSTEVAAVRKRLVHMLAIALDIRIEAGEITDHDYQRATLLEILIRLFSEKLIEALRQGMPRQYCRVSEDLSALRGKFDITRQFTTLAASPQKLACQYDPFSEDITLNRIMKATVKRLAAVSSSAANQRRLRELSFAYADVSDMHVTTLKGDEVSIDRTNARWRQLLELARMLLSQRFQTTSAGSGSGFSLLFEMNTLFEEYVARMLARALAGTGRQVVAQGGRLYCLENDQGRRLFQTRPDILVKRGGIVEQVIDTKWKRIANRVDDSKQGIAQADVYQMMAYGQLYQCPRLMLLYPHHRELGNSTIRVPHRIAIDGGVDQLELATIDISTSNGTAGWLRALCADVRAECT